MKGISAIRICGLAGDQQSATIGQGCLSPGPAKATLGTGAFILAPTGTVLPRSDNRLLGTILRQQGGCRHYALEGSIFVAGSLIKWLRDELGLIRAAQETEALARSVTDNGGVSLLPALSGLGAPHWRPEARGVIAGLTQGTTRAHIVRAALESMAHQVHDLAGAFAADGAPWTNLRIDGGMSANDWIAQDPADVETTARGAAMLAAVGAGLHASLEDATAAMPIRQCFKPRMTAPTRAARLGNWNDILRTAIGGS